MTRTHAFVAACAAVLLVGLSAACGPGDPPGSGDDDDAPNDPCTTPGQTRCVGDSYQICQDGTFQTQEVCSGVDVCAPTIGCAECDPREGGFCDGSDLYMCNSDGTKGGFVMNCGVDGCSGGACGSDECGGAGTQLIYVVDKDYNLLSFNPAMDQHTFTLIGQLNCPAGTPWPAVTAAGELTATPFSMSVDRSGRAWVLYTSGEIFHVSTTDASCQPSSWVKGTNGFKLFGMGFVADAPGSNSERLYISGGSDTIYSGDTANENLGSIDPTSYAVQTLGPLTNLEYSPELTGTGNAELYGYFPGFVTSGSVARLNKQTATREQSWNLPSLPGEVIAWAFAHWGGRYYIFVTTTDFLGTTMTSQVLRLDPMANGGAGQVVTVVPSSPYMVVGAGVSTCAPVVVE